MFCVLTHKQITGAHSICRNQLSVPHFVGAHFAQERALSAPESFLSDNNNYE